MSRRKSQRGRSQDEVYANQGLSTASDEVVRRMSGYSRSTGQRHSRPARLTAALGARGRDQRGHRVAGWGVGHLDRQRGRHLSGAAAVAHVEFVPCAPEGRAASPRSSSAIAGTPGSEHRCAVEPLH